LPAPKDWIATCFRQWLSVRGGHDAAETRDCIEQVRTFLLANGMARFIPAWKETQSRIPVRDVAGFRDQVGDGWDYYVTTTAWKEVCAGFDPRRTAAVMKQKGYIDAREEGRSSKSVRVPEFGKHRLYHVRSTFLEDANET
jgi:putative DNA primase/helicase